jgi:hypothetical protein
MNYVPKMNRNEFANLKYFYNFNLLHFSVGRVLMIGNPAGKKSKVYKRSKVRGFDSNLIRITSHPGGGEKEIIE